MFSVLVSSIKTSDMDWKKMRNCDESYFSNFKQNHQKWIWKFQNNCLFNTNIFKKTLFCFSNNVSTATNVQRWIRNILDAHRWISKGHSSQHWSLLQQLWSSLKTLKSELIHTGQKCYNGSVTTDVDESKMELVFGMMFQTGNSC